MPYRAIPLAVEEMYHVFNRSIAKQPIFPSSLDYQRALDVFSFYLYENPPLRFSYYSRLASNLKADFLEKLRNSHDPLVEIISFCLMPNHVHFLLKNLKENGISRFMSNFQNSYAKYFNTKTGRTGNLFQSMFKAVRIESDEQLLHVSRYIHLNPVTSYLIKTEQLKSYPWSSHFYYLSRNENFLNKDLILSFFKSVEEYEKFVLDQVDYQREIDKIKHLILEEM